MAGSDARMIITIDGPAGTGKSVVAARLAALLGIACLDTGAMYRCVALCADRAGVDADDAKAMKQVLASHHIDFDWEMEPPVVRIDGTPVSHLIRSEQVSAQASKVARLPVVRQAMVQAQRRIADDCGRLVSEGRDQGSVVFPDAEARFFLTADAAVRGQRRIDQLRSSGNEVDEDLVRRDIQARDMADSTRSEGPLVKPDGAIEIDTTDRSIDDVVSLIKSHLNQLDHGAC